MNIPQISHEQAKAFAMYFNPKDIIDFCKQHTAEFIEFLRQETSKGCKKSARELERLSVMGGGIATAIAHQARATDKNPP